MSGDCEGSGGPAPKAAILAAEAPAASAALDGAYDERRDAKPDCSQWLARATLWGSGNVSKAFPADSIQNPEP